MLHMCGMQRASSNFHVDYIHMERTSLLLGACFFCGFRQLGNTMVLETGQTQQFPLDLVVPKIPSSLVFLLPCLRLRPPSRYLPIAPLHGQTPKPGRQQQKNRWKRGGSIIFEIRFLGDLQDNQENQATFCEMPLKLARFNSQKNLLSQLWTWKFSHFWWKPGLGVNVKRWWIDQPIQWG